MELRRTDALATRARATGVEDHADTASAFSRLLGRNGFSVTVAATLDEARHLLNEGDFEVLVADIGLPDGDGWELGPLAARRGAIAVALTGYDSIRDVAASNASGFVASGETRHRPSSESRHRLRVRPTRPPHVGCLKPPR